MTERRMGEESEKDDVACPSVGDDGGDPPPEVPTSGGDDADSTDCCVGGGRCRRTSVSRDIVSYSAAVEELRCSAHVTRRTPEQLVGVHRQVQSESVS